MVAAFTGNGLVRTAQVKSGNQQARQRQLNDRLVTIESYDLAAGKMRVTEEIADGKKLTLDVHIDENAIKRNNASAQEKGLEHTAKFKGHLIDDKMQRDLKVGSKVVIEKAEILKRVNKDQADLYEVVAQRIINVPNPEPEKAFTGVFTVSSWDNRITFVQHWHERAIDSGDQEAVKKLAEQMDANVAKYGQKEHDRLVVTPSIGVQLRAVTPHASAENPKVKYQVLDTSGALDWIRAVKDDSGEKVSNGHPLDSENFLSYLEGYKAHVEQLFPGQDVRVEICPYFNYQASTQSSTLALKENSYDPLTQMATAKTRLSQDPDSVVIGKNWAVKGIVQISADYMHREGKNVDFVPTFYVNKLHANNIKGHVHAWVNAADGGKTVPHPDLQRIRPEQADKPADVPANRPAPQQESSVSPGFEDNGFDDADDPFGEFSKPKV